MYASLSLSIYIYIYVYVYIYIYIHTYTHVHIQVYVDTCVERISGARSSAPAEAGPPQIGRALRRRAPAY